MSNSYEVSFPGGVAVEATFRGHTVRTDQPSPLGGDSALSPFEYFWVSLATCAGFYALRFCQERNISTEGLAVTLHNERDPEKKKITRSTIDVALPEGFPDKYREAILRAVDQCAVKKTVANPPEFVIQVAERELVAQD